MKNAHSIKELFSEWTDFDIGEYYLACMFGLVEYTEDYSTFRETKAIYNMKNSVGEALCGMLEELVNGGILIYDADLCQYKWNDSFVFDSRS